MNKIFYTILLLLATMKLHAQSKVDFENFNLSKGQTLNGSDLKGGFNSGNVFLWNVYNTEFKYWAGWSISTATDTLNGSFTNEFSAASGNGADASLTYAVSYGEQNKLALNGKSLGKPVKSISINNTTYAALSMKNGDSFAKKFGGLSGNDKDYFLLTIKAWHSGALSKDSVDFYLADYRFNDNSKDYIVKSWKSIDLTSLGNVDSLQFKLKSSDVGNFGINTPTYFCIDNVTLSDPLSAYDVDLSIRQFYPNPTSNSLMIQLVDASLTQQYVIFDTNGHRLLSGQISNSSIDVNTLVSGTYILQIQSGSKKIQRLFSKI